MPHFQKTKKGQRYGMRLLASTLRLTVPIFLSALIEWGLVAGLIIGLFLIMPDYPNIAFGVTVLLLPSLTSFLAISLIRTGLLVRDKTNAPNVDRMIRNSFLFLGNVWITVATVFSLFLAVTTILYFNGDVTRADLQLVFNHPVRAFETGVAQSMVTSTTITSFVIFMLMSLYIFCCTMMPLAAAAADVAYKLTSFDLFWGFGVARNLLFRYCLVLSVLGLPIIFYLLEPIYDAVIADHKAIIGIISGDKRTTILGEVAAANIVSIGLAGVVFILLFSIWAAITTTVFIEYRDYVDRQEKFIE
jgi:hypothetical protein